MKLFATAAIGPAFNRLPRKIGPPSPTETLINEFAGITPQSNIPLIGFGIFFGSAAGKAD